MNALLQFGIPNMLKCLTVLLVLMLLGCALPQSVTVVRCPAASPIGLDCKSCVRLAAHDGPTSLEGGERAYLRALAALERCIATNEVCVERDGVWQDSWGGCG